MNDVLIRAVGDTLLHSVWQGAVVALAVFTVERTGGIRAAHRAHVMGLLAMLVIPALGLWGRLDDALAGATAAQGEASLETLLFMQQFLTASATGAWHSVAVAVWASGAIAMCLWLCLGALAQQHLRRSAQSLGDDWNTLVTETAGRLGLRRKVRIAGTTRLQSPGVIGLWNPLVLIPVALIPEVPATYWQAVIAHELAHVQRLDALTMAVQRVAESVFYFHPAVWWMSRRLDVLRELRCDSLVTERFEDRLHYARALAALEELRAKHAGSTASLSFSFTHLAFTKKGNLMTRIRNIVEPATITRSARSRLLPLGAVGVLGAALLAAPSCSSTASAPEPGAEIPVQAEAPPKVPVQLATSASSDNAAAPDAPDAPSAADGSDGGRLPPEVIRRTIRQNHGRLRKCYEEALGRDPKLAGRVNVRFVIEEDGSVRDAVDRDSDLPDAAVIACVVGVYEDLSFPPPKGGIVTVVYPVHFAPD